MENSIGMRERDCEGVIGARRGVMGTGLVGLCGWRGRRDGKLLEIWNGVV